MRKKKSIPSIMKQYESTIVEIITTVYLPNGEEDELGGTGFFYDTKGLIITANHAVRNDIDESEATEEELKIFRKTQYRYWVKYQDLDDKERYVPADFAGSDPRSDVALLRIAAKKPLNIKPAVIGDADKVKVGEEVITIGNPTGFEEKTVTAGIITQTEREFEGEGMPSFKIKDAFQTSTTINFGNSGGPLINQRGEVIGVVNALDSDKIGPGLAVPISHFVRNKERMEKEEVIVRGWTGLKLMEEDIIKSGCSKDFLDLIKAMPDLEKFSKRDIIALDKLTGEKDGALVTDIEKGSPADSDIRKADYIVRFDGKKVEDDEDLLNFIAETPITPIGTSKKVEILRIKNGKVINHETMLKIIKKPRFAPEKQ